ncbi:hypothetical protein V6N13_014336 [Hibiscus sabdariffa]
MPLPLNIRNDSQWMGVAFCCIFVNGDALKDEDIRCKVYIHRREPRHVDSSRIVLGKNFNQPVKNDHLFLRYLSRDILYPYSLKNGCGESEIENISTPDCSNHECDELESSFTYNARGKGPKVKQCGVRIVYQKDLEDFQLMKDMKEDSASDGSIANGSIEAEDEARPHRMQIR